MVGFQGRVSGLGFRVRFQGQVSRSGSGSGFMVRFWGRVLRSGFIVGGQVSWSGLGVEFWGWISWLGFVVRFRESVGYWG